jgi:uncharacterized Zn finger protein
LIFEDRFIASFSRAVVNRGMDYYVGDRVRALRVSETRAEAEVGGSQRHPYRVRIAVEGKTSHLAVDCTCPHAERGENCKHILATLLELADIPDDFAVPGDRRLRLRALDRSVQWDSDALEYIDVTVSNAISDENDFDRGYDEKYGW